jgi:hypothetical protein
MRSGGYATRPAAVAARRADATIHAAKDRLKQASRGFLTFAAGGGGGTTTTTSGNIDNDDDDCDGDHPRDGTSGDRSPVPRSPKASSRDPNARPGRIAKVTWDLPPEPSFPPPERRLDWRTYRRAAAATAAARAGSGLSKDASSSLVGSFPILSPDHKFDDDDGDGASFFGNNDNAEEEETNATKEDDGTDDADAKKEGGDRDDDDADDDARGAKADDGEAAVGARRRRR